MRKAVWLTALGVALGLVWPATLHAQPYPSEVVGFEEGTVGSPSDQEIWRSPQVSGSTFGIMMNSTGAPAANGANRSTTFGGAYNASPVGYYVFWQWTDPTDQNAWVRLTTLDTADRPNPSLDTTGKIKFDILNASLADFTEVGMCVGIRETGTDVPQLSNGGTTSNGETAGIEWVGVSGVNSVIEAGSNGIIDSTVAGDDILVDTNGFQAISWGPDRTLQSVPAPGSDDYFAHGYFYSAAGGKIPVCAQTLSPFLFDWEAVEIDLQTGDITLTPNGGSSTTYPGEIVNFANGNGVLDAPNNRGVLEHLAFTNLPADAGALVDIVIDNVQFIANQTDPAVPPTVVTPIVAGDTQVTVTNLQFTVDQVKLYLNGTTLVDTKDVTNNDDVVFDLPPATFPLGAVTGQVFTATQREGDSQDVSAPSTPVTVVAAPPPYTFSILLDETGNGSCAATWEWVPVTEIKTQAENWIPQGTAQIIPDSTQWQTVDVPLTDDAVVLAGSGGNGMINHPSPTGFYTIDTIWFSLAPDADSNSWEVYLDKIEYINSGGVVGGTLLDMEADNVNRLQNARYQSVIETGFASAISTTASYSGTHSQRIAWTFPDPYDTNPYWSLGILQRVGWSCGTSELIPDDSVAIRFHMLAREQNPNPLVPLPTVAAPIVVGTQDTVQVTNDVNAVNVQLFINGEAVGPAVAPTGTTTEFGSLTLAPGDSVSARQEVGTNGWSDAAYPRVVLAAPEPPVIQAPVPPGSETVTVNGVLTAPYATASVVNLYVNDILTTNGVGGTATVVLTTDALQQDDVLKVTQVVNGEESDFSEPVVVDFPAPLFYAAPAEGDTAVTVMGLTPGIDAVTVMTTNGVKSFTQPVTSAVDRIDVAVSGLVAGDVIEAYQSAGALNSAMSATEVVTTNVTTTIMACDDFESYADQAAMNAVWTQWQTSQVELSTQRNATYPTGEKSAMGPASNAYMTRTLANFTPTETNPVVLNVNIYDPVGQDPAGSVVNWVEINGLGTDSDDFLLHIGMLGWANTDNIHYDFRAVFNGGPNWVDLDDYDGPLRTLGWHTFTVVNKGLLFDVYVDGLLSKKNLPLTEAPVYSRADIGGGYAGTAAVWFDDFCLTQGPVNFIQIAEQAPPPPSVRSPIVAGDTALTVSNVLDGSISVTVYDQTDTAIGTAPVTTTNGLVAVDLMRALIAGEPITATQTNAVDESEQSSPLEVGSGHGPVLLALGVTDADGIEWVGVDATTSGAPIGLVSLSPSNGWQTVTFDPTSPHITGFTGNGEINAGSGALEHLAIKVDWQAANRSTGVYRMYIDNVKSGSTTITDFEGYDLGSEVLFQEPGFSGSTGGDLSYPPGASVVSDNFANGGTQSDLITWFWRDTTAERWLRLTTFGLNPPTISFSQPVSMDILLLETCAAKGDMDGDCNIDLDDHALFVDCMTGPTTQMDLTCTCADVNDDGRVDLIDFSAFQRSFGTTIPGCTP